MKYKLIEINPTSCTCGKSYQLVEDTDGYDLIQLKRGVQANIANLKLEPGEPAFVLDTGKLYVGNSNGVPILINPTGGGTSAGSASLVVKGDYEDGALITVPYASMITASGEHPTADDVGKYLTALVLNSDDKPVGEAYITNWNYSSTSAQFKYGSYSAASSVTKIIYVQSAATRTWIINSDEFSSLTEDSVITVRVKDTSGNLVYPTWFIENELLVLSFATATSGEAVIYIS